MNIIDFDVYRDLLKETSGLFLTQDKAYLLESRLNPVAKKWGYETIASMTHKLRSVPERDLVNDIVEAMTTNETSFYRESKLFDVFKNTVIPYYANQDDVRTVRIWCTATSSGQEAYSLAMMLKDEKTRIQDIEFEIIASDISHEIIEKAKEGLYSQLEVQRGLPVSMLMRNFTQDGDKWMVNDDIKKMVTFKTFNLLDSMASFESFDIVFCQNVLVYFEPATQKEVLERIQGQLKDDGFLFLSGAETVSSVTDQFQTIPDKHGLYAKTNSVHFKTA